MKQNTPDKDMLYLPDIFAAHEYCMAMLRPIYNYDKTPVDLECIDCFPTGEMIGKRNADLFADRTDKRFLEHCWRVAGSGAEFETEANAFKDQATRTFCVRIHEMAGLIIITTEDITKRKQKEAALLHAEDELALLAAEKYAQIIQSATIAFCIVQVVFDELYEAIDYIFLETNAAFVKQTTLKNAVGKSMMELEPNHEKEWCRKYGEVIKTRKPLHFIADAQHIGNYVYEVWAFPLSQKAGNQVVIFFNDITERSENQKSLIQSLQKYRRMLESFGHNFGEDETH
ncbi:MAG: hypothetical protein QM802_03140 [Agriterribacter sp.]